MATPTVLGNGTITFGDLSVQNQAAPMGNTGGNGFVYENVRTVTQNYTMTSGYSGMSTGPITINAGISVTIPAGGRWVVL